MQDLKTWHWISETSESAYIFTAMVKIAMGWCNTASLTTEELTVTMNIWPQVSMCVSYMIEPVPSLVYVVVPISCLLRLPHHYPLTE